MRSIGCHPGSGCTGGGKSRRFYPGLLPGWILAHGNCGTPRNIRAAETESIQPLPARIRDKAGVVTGVLSTLVVPLPAPLFLKY